MPIPKKKLRKRLLKKFGFEEVQGTKHEALTLFINNRKVATTRFSRSHRDISDAILKKVAEQIGVTLGFLKEMEACTKSRDDYLRHLQETNRLS